MGIYILKSQDRSEDIGIVLEGQKVLQGLDNFALATAMLFGLMYALNLNYPPEMKFTFEQGSYAVWKSMEFDLSIFQVWKSMEKINQSMEKYLCFQTIVPRVF